MKGTDEGRLKGEVPPDPTCAAEETQTSGKGRHSEAGRRQSRLHGPTKAYDSASKAAQSQNNI